MEKLTLFLTLRAIHSLKALYVCYRSPSIKVVFQTFLVQIFKNGEPQQDLRVEEGWEAGTRSLRQNNFKVCL